MKKHCPSASLFGYSIIAFIMDFMPDKDRKREWLYIRYRKTARERKDIEINFYANDSPNDNSKSEF